MQRKEKLAVGEIYHIFSKSIADFKIFNSNGNVLRMKYMLKYYQVVDIPCRFSKFMELKNIQKQGFIEYFNFVSKEKEKIVKIIAYCIMPTHIHLILKQLKENGISNFMGNILNSYSRYFNTKYKRKGPLWEGRFKNISVKTDEQLLHLTRYIHLNPVTARLIDKPENWQASSYNEYLENSSINERICEYDKILQIDRVSYKSFVKDRISYQRELNKIKKMLCE